MPFAIETFPEVPKHTQTVELDGIDYRLTLAWRERNRAWYMSLRTIEGDPIFRNKRVAPQSMPMNDLERPNQPPGEFLIRGPAKPKREALGRTLLILYVSEDEFIEQDTGGDRVVVRP